MCSLGGPITAWPALSCQTRTIAVYRAIPFVFFRAVFGAIPHLEEPLCGLRPHHVGTKAREV
jgi:hypothetical protein